MPPEQLPMRVLRTREQVTDEEVLVRNRAGEEIALRVNAAPVLAPSGELMGVALAGRDITAYKQLERLREEWMAVIAHDLRQPVGVIALTAQLLVRKLDDEERLRTPLERIDRAARRLERMIADLLDLSRLEAQRLTLERTERELGQLVREALHELAPVLAGRQVMVTPAGEPLIVRVDPGRILQVLGNLLSNAVKYSDPGSDIVVELRRREQAAELAVRNRGRGIAADELQHIFDRFARGTSSRGTKVEGSGLGLAICRGLVEAHGGRIWAESVPGEHTTFRVSLPLLSAGG